MENKPYRIGTIRDQKLRDNSMTVSAGTAETPDQNGIFFSGTVFHSDHGTGIG